MYNNVVRFIYQTDSYKLGHWRMYDPATQANYAYDESRKGAKYPETVFFGLQVILKRFFEGIVVTQEDLAKARVFCKKHFGRDNLFNEEGWQHIVTRYKGKLPIRIKAVAEGTPVEIDNVMMTVESLDEKCHFLTNFCESILQHIWYPCNIATISRDLKKSIKESFEQTGADMNNLPYMLHDFGFRGATCSEAAAIGGLGHLVNFKGTDTVPAIIYGEEYYGCDMAGQSVLATEHSIMSGNGEDGEFALIERLVIENPDGIFSCVYDTFDIERAIKHTCTSNLKDLILARNGKFVIRPDSPRYQGDTPWTQILWILDQLAASFGSTINAKGFKVLNPKVGVIYGDGLSVAEIKQCLQSLAEFGWSTDSCVYGMGGGLLQKHNRDTQRNAFKSSAQKRNGVWHDVYKKPKDISKASKRGKLKLIRTPKGFMTIPLSSEEGEHFEDQLVTVFEHGRITKEYTLDEVRKNAEII